MERTVTRDIPEDELTGGRVYVNGLPDIVSNPVVIDQRKGREAANVSLNQTDLYIEVPVIGGLVGAIFSMPIAAIVSICNREAGLMLAIPIVSGASLLTGGYLFQKEWAKHNKIVVPSLEDFLQPLWGSHRLGDCKLPT